MAHKIRSKKSPFANLAMEIFEREILILLQLHFPDFHSGITPPHAEASGRAHLSVCQSHNLLKTLQQQLPHSQVYSAFIEHYRKAGIDLKGEKHVVFTRGTGNPVGFCTRPGRVRVRVGISVPAIFKTSSRTSKTVKKWMRYGQFKCFDHISVKIRPFWPVWGLTRPENPSGSG